MAIIRAELASFVRRGSFSLGGFLDRNAVRGISVGMGPRPIGRNVMMGMSIVEMAALRNV